MRQAFLVIKQQSVVSAPCHLQREAHLAEKFLPLRNWSRSVSLKSQAR
ncbi:MAG: hypothetical protein CM15mP92_1710 [Halieaceae bacterium]|nr:MAG: hypothetical protein CM15mP92_1710 [Halieaceae bacterium]